MSVETSRTEKQREIRPKNGTEGSRTIGQKRQHMHNGNSRRRGVKRTEDILGAIMTMNFPQITVRHQNTDPGNSKNIKQGRGPKYYILAYHILTAENQRFREKNLILEEARRKMNKMLVRAIT